MPAVHVPTRTCVGCRQRTAAPELVRLRLANGNVVVADERAPSGRGAWIHPKESCVLAAIKARAFGRAFRASAEAADPSALCAAVIARARHSL